MTLKQSHPPALTHQYILKLLVVNFYTAWIVIRSYIGGGQTKTVFGFLQLYYKHCALYNYVNILSHLAPEKPLLES